MAASSKLMITGAERRFPVRIRVVLPVGGFGKRLGEMYAWLDENCGADGWAMTPSGLRGVVNDAVAVYFLDPTLASGFVVRWCAGNKIETTEGAFRAGRMRQRLGLGRRHTGRLSPTVLLPWTLFAPDAAGSDGQTLTIMSS